MDSIIHFHLLGKEIEVYGAIVTWPKSTASSGLAGVGKAWGRAFQGRSWTGPNENSALDLLREVRPELQGGPDLCHPGGQGWRGEDTGLGIWTLSLSSRYDSD